jgi:hypothetical protein
LFNRKGTKDRKVRRESGAGCGLSIHNCGPSIDNRFIGRDELVVVGVKRIDEARLFNRKDAEDRKARRENRAGCGVLLLNSEIRFLRSDF